MGEGVSWESALLLLCMDYSEERLGFLHVVMERPPTDEELDLAGAARLDRAVYGRLDRAANYLSVYDFSGKTVYYTMLDKMASPEMGAGNRLVGSLRGKGKRHNWASGSLCLGLAREGKYWAASK